MVRLKALPYWARIGTAVTILGAAYFLVSAVSGAVTGVGATDVVFDFLLAGAFMLLAAAIGGKASAQSVASERGTGPLDY